MPKRTSWRVWVLPLGIFSLASGLAADVVTVNAVGTGGLWSNPNTWSPAVVPNNSSGTTYIVNIGSPTTFVPSVEVDISPTVNTVSTTASNLEVLNGSTLTAGAVSSGVLGVTTVDSGAALNANTLAASSVQINGTAAIASVTTLGSLSVGKGGLANVGSISPFVFDGNISVAGTLNIAGNSPFGITFVNLSVVGGTVTLGTGNLHSLALPNTLVNKTGWAPGPGIVLIGNFSSPCFNGLCMGSNATYDEVIDSSTGYGTLTVYPSFSSPLSLGGTLQITLADSYIPPVGQSFNIIDTNGGLVGGPPQISGAFANIEGQTFNDGKEKWDVEYTDIPGFGAGVDLVAATNVVPEPSLLLFTGFGLFGIVVWSRSRRRSNS